MGVKCANSGIIPFLPSDSCLCYIKVITQKTLSSGCGIPSGMLPNHSTSLFRTSVRLAALQLKAVPDMTATSCGAPSLSSRLSSRHLAKRLCLPLRLREMNNVSSKMQSQKKFSPWTQWA